MNGSVRVLMHECIWSDVGRPNICILHIYFDRNRYRISKSLSVHTPHTLNIERMQPTTCAAEKFAHNRFVSCRSSETKIQGKFYILNISSILMTHTNIASSIFTSALLLWMRRKRYKRLSGSKKQKKKKTAKKS